MTSLIASGPLLLVFSPRKKRGHVANGRVAALDAAGFVVSVARRGEGRSGVMYRWLDGGSRRGSKGLDGGVLSSNRRPSSTSSSVGRDGIDVNRGGCLRELKADRIVESTWLGGLCAGRYW